MKKFVMILLLTAAAGLHSQAQSVSFDLPALLRAGKLTTINREVQALPAGEKPGVKLSAKPGDGVTWLNDVSFGNGTIEVDIRGKDVAQESFLGIAFHGIDAKTLDAVYFRPFNFRAQDAVKRSHSVQYVSHPQYPWSVLREKFNGQYEKAVTPVPDPNGWFHARITVNGQAVKVYVNDSKEPSLSINLLNERRNGKLGLWVGNGSDGDFANLRITPAKQ